LGPQSKSGLIDYDLPRNRLIELLKKNKIPYVDMSTATKAAHSEQDPVMFAEGHITAKGHDVFARELLNELQARSWHLK
jgi:lysophospholipase L1-like esterase